jgi:hypothetical protein
MKIASAFFVPFLATVLFAQTEQPNPTPPSNGPTTDQTAPSEPIQMQTTPGAEAQPNSPDGKGTTIRGCLEAGTDHNYTLTDKNGIRYMLVAIDANALNSHVGEEVEVDGEPTTGNDASAGAGSSTGEPTASTGQSFEVNGAVRQISDKCAM